MAMSSRPAVLGFSSLNQRLVALLVAGHAPTVDALLSLGSSPYEGLVMEGDSSDASVRCSLLGWALGTDLDDERGTPALNRLREAAVAKVVNRKSANQAVTRWSQGEWRNLSLLNKGQQGLLRWSLDAQAQVLTVALPLVEAALREQVGLASAMHHDAVLDHELRRLLQRQLLADLLLHPGDATVTRAVSTARAVLDEAAWDTPMTDPAPGQAPNWPDLPWPWMAAVSHRWQVLRPWLNDQPVEVWLAPVPPALQASTAPPLIDPVPNGSSPVRHLLDLVHVALVGHTPARYDQRTVPVLASLMATAFGRFNRDAVLRATFGPHDLVRLRHWVSNRHQDIHEMVDLPAWLTAMEQVLLHHTADMVTAPSIGRPRARL